MVLTSQDSIFAPAAVFTLLSWVRLLIPEPYCLRPVFPLYSKTLLRGALIVSTLSRLLYSSPYCSPFVCLALLLIHLSFHSKGLAPLLSPYCSPLIVLLHSLGPLLSPYCFLSYCSGTLIVMASYCLYPV